MNILKKFWHSIATRFIPQLLAVSLRKYNETLAQLEEQKLITESWREHWRIKKVEYDAFQTFMLSVSHMDLNSLTKEEIMKMIEDIKIIFKSDCENVTKMWKDEDRRKKLSHAFKIFAKEE